MGVVGEPGDALVGRGEEPLGERDIGRRPGFAHHHAGEGEVFDVIGREAERHIARGIGLEIERRQHEGGVGDAGLERRKPRRGDAADQFVVVGALQTVGRRHPLEIDGGDVVGLADRNGLALELGDGFQLGLGDQRVRRGIADDANDGERRAFVDGVDGIVVADAQRNIERAAGELLGDRGSALREIDLDVEIFAGEKSFARRDVERPQRRLAAERAADDLVRGAGRPPEQRRADEAENNASRNFHATPGGESPTIAEIVMAW